MGWKLHLFHAALLLACTCAAGNNDCEIFSQRIQTECSPGNFVESQDQSELGSNGYLSSLFKLCLWVNGQGWLRVMIPFELFSNERSKQQTTDSWSPNVIYSIQFYLVLCCPAPPHPIQSTVFFIAHSTQICLLSIPPFRMLVHSSAEISFFGLVSRIFAVFWIGWLLLTWSRLDPSRHCLILYL